MSPPNASSRTEPTQRGQVTDLSESKPREKPQEPDRKSSDGGSFTKYIAKDASGKVDQNLVRGVV